MTLSLATIEVEAFKNFAAVTRVDFGGFGPGLHFVHGVNQTNERLGSNGAGKSTLFSDAPTWCLYGRTVGGLRTTDVRSWLTKKPPCVALTFRVGDNEQIVQRGPRATDLTINGRAVGQDDVDALVGLNYEAWAQAVIWGQGRPLFLDLPPRDKMALLSDALGLERWERRADAASTRAKRLEHALTSLDGALKGLETARGHAEAALAAAKASAEAWGKDHAARLLDLRGALSAATKTALAVEAKRGEADLTAESVGLRLREVRPAIDTLRDEARNLDAQHRRLLEAVAAAHKELAAANAQIVTFTKKGVCPTCGQTVTKGDADHHVVDLKKRTTAFRKTVSDVESALETTEKAREKIRTHLEKGLGDLAVMEGEEQESSAALLMLERRAAETRAARNAAETALNTAEAEQNPYRDAASDARKRLKEIDTELREGDTRAGKLEASAERARFWTRGFRDVRLTIVDEVLGDLRETTAAVLEDLGLGEWVVNYTTEHETKAGTTTRALAATVQAPGAPEGVRWEVYSGGEGQRLRLASALALGEVLLAHAGAQVNFRVLDEPTRGLSREGVRDMTEMLANYAEEADIRLIYVDHHSSDGLVFASSVDVVCNKDGAHLQE